MNGELDGRIGLVTGAGRGLGRSISLHLSGLGATVVAADIDEATAKKTASLLEDRGRRALAVPLDVTDDLEVENTLAAVEEEFGGYEFVVNNAGIDVTEPVRELTPEQWRRIVAVNLTGPFLISRCAMRHFAGRKRGGHIVNIVSTAAKRAWANASAYHASKWGLLGLSHALHVEGREIDVAVTAVVAGGMRTPFILERFPDADLSLLQDPDAVARSVGFVLTQPPGTVIPEIMTLPRRETSWP